MFQNFQKSYFYITFLDNCFWICRQIPTAPIPSFPTFIWEPGQGWLGGWPIQKINFSIIWCYAHVVRCGCVGWVGRTLWQIRSMSWELIDCSWQWICFFTMFTLYTTLINQKIYSFQRNWVVANIPQEDHNKNQTKFVSVLRHQTILAKLQTTVGERQKLL